MVVRQIILDMTVSEGVSKVPGLWAGGHSDV